MGEVKTIPLTFSAPTTVVSDTLPITISSTQTMGGDDKPLLIALWVPLTILPQALQAGQMAAVPLDDAGVTISGGGGMWQAWSVAGGANDPTLHIELRNDADVHKPSGTIDADHPLTLTLPVETAALTNAEITHQYGTKLWHGHVRLSGSSKKTAVTIAPDTRSAGQAAPQPVVELRTDVDNPTAVEPGTPVNIIWKVEKGVTGTLMGPFPGRTVIDLGDQLASGQHRVRVMGPQVYVLHATVQSDGAGEIEVTRTLVLNAFTGDNRGYLKLAPTPVLPHGKVTAHWAAWGVTSATLHINYLSQGGTRHVREILIPRSDELTDGSGDYQFTAPAAGVAKVSIELTDKSGTLLPIEARPDLELEAWDPLSISFDELPKRLAYAAGMLALLTTDGQLRIARGLGNDDNISMTQEFRKVSGHWLAVASGGDSFVALRKSHELELVQFDENGEIVSHNARTIAGYKDCATARLVTLNDRAFVTDELGPREIRWQPCPVSFSLIDPNVKARPEPVLQIAANMDHLIAVDDAVYALGGFSGELLRFDFKHVPDETGTLALPKIAAAGKKSPPVNGRPGVPVAVEGLLVILTNGENKNDKGVVQDWVYDPQLDQWIECGHGLDVHDGVAACRPYGAKSTERLFVVQKTGSARATGHTLSFNSPDRHLFSPDHFRGNGTLPATVELLDAVVFFPDGADTESLTDLLIGHQAFSRTAPPGRPYILTTNKQRLALRYRSTAAPIDIGLIPEQQGRLEPPDPLRLAAAYRVLGQYEADFRPGIGVRSDGVPDIAWVELPGGRFTIGGDDEVFDAFRSLSVREEEVAGFAIARYPVTNWQWGAFLAAEDGYDEAEWWARLAGGKQKRAEPRWDFGNHPRETVNWTEAMAFCRWLTMRLGLTGSGEEIRLPTEVEWERAARGAGGRIYPWGNKYESGYANINETARGVGPYYLAQTSAVGIYPQNSTPEGVCDLSGNVDEWTLTEFESGANGNLMSRAARVLRGGSLDDDHWIARAASRGRYDPHVRYLSWGFGWFARPLSALTSEALVSVIWAGGAGGTPRVVCRWSYAVGRQPLDSCPA